MLACVFLQLWSWVVLTGAQMFSWLNRCTLLAALDAGYDLVTESGPLVHFQLFWLVSWLTVWVGSICQSFQNPLWLLPLKFALARSLFCQIFLFSSRPARLYLPYKVLSSWVFGRGQVICKQRLQWCSHWILRRLHSHRNKLSGNLRTNISETLSTASTGSKTGNSNPTSLSFHPTLCLE